MTMRYECGHPEQENTYCEICTLRAELEAAKGARDAALVVQRAAMTGMEESRRKSSSLQKLKDATYADFLLRGEEIKLLRDYLNDISNNSCDCSCASDLAKEALSADVMKSSADQLREERDSLRAEIKEDKTHKEVWSNQFKKVCEERDSARALLAARDARVVELEGALKKAEHELIVVHNLDASDDSERLFRNPFVIDTSATLHAVQFALYGPSLSPTSSAAPEPKEMP